MSDDLLIKISADAGDVTAAYENIQKQTTDLSESLTKVAEVSAVAFAALTAQVVESLSAFEASDQASKALSASLQNQGIYTDALKDSYGDYADAVEKTTGFSKTQITQAQAVAQTYLGQVPVTEDLTKAIADLAQQQGISLPQAATELGKAIGSGTGMLLRQGLQFSATDTEAQRYQKTLDFVTLKAGGMAAAANTGLGAIRGLQTAFEESQVELGQRFAPAAAAVIQALTGFLTPSKDASGALVDLKAGLIAVGVVVTGLGIVLPLAAQGFLAVRAAVIALEIGAAPLVLIPVAIAALAVAVVELGLHWQQVSATVRAVVGDMVNFVSAAFSGLSAVLKGALSLDPTAIKAGLAQIGDAFKQVGTAAATAWASVPVSATRALTEQDAVKKQFADKAAAQQKADEAAKAALQAAENQAILLELNNASAAEIALKKQEIQELKALTTTKNQDEKTLLRQQIADTQALETEQETQDLQRQKDFAKTTIAAQTELNNQKVTNNQNLSKKELAQIQASQLTQTEAEKQVYSNELKTQVAAHNTFLTEQAKYGTAYAAINEYIHSSEIQGLQQATSDLTQLTQSKNSTLKEIGQVASIANIVIKTAESAMNIYAGFSAIPIVGPALGIAGAAAAVAFGAEQIGNVTAAATGGVVGGTGFGDSQPYMLEPGELIAPRQNFDEVVNSVAQSRANGSDTDSQGGGIATVVLQLQGQLMDFIEAKLVQRKYLNISIQGSR